MRLRAVMLIGLSLAAAGCSAPGRVATDDASLDREFIRTFGLPSDMPPPDSRDRPASGLARRSPWLFFARSSPSAPPAPKPPPPIPKPKVEPIPKAPAPGVSWQPNTYEWNGNSFIWLAGRWVPVPPGLVWQYGTWVMNEFGEWRWRTGGWAPPGAYPVIQQANAAVQDASGDLSAGSFPSDPVLP